MKHSSLSGTVVRDRGERRYAYRPVSIKIGGVRSSVSVH